MRKWKFNRFFDFEQTVEISEKGGIRYLHLGSKTVQSAMQINDPNELVLSYTRAMMGFLLFRPEPKRVLMIGLGGGSLPKYFYHFIPHSEITVIENSQKVLMVAKRQFCVPENNDRFKIVVEDGVLWLSKNKRLFDVIMADGYNESSQVESLASESFYSGLHQALSKEGVLVVNSWTKDGHLKKNITKLRSSFTEIILIPAERRGNTAILAFKKPSNLLGNLDFKERARVLDLKYRLGFNKMLTSLKEATHYEDM